MICFHKRNRALMNRMIDFSVLGLIFYLSSLFLSVDNGGRLILLALGYASMVLVFVSFSRRFFARHYLTLGDAIRQITCNAIGILAATFIMLVVERIMSADGGVYVALLFSSVMAFFVLGTLLPLVHKNPRLV